MKRLLLIAFFCPSLLFGQNTIGFPDVTNYSKQAYGGGLQNWDIKQDKNGVIYIANNEGLLCFDGRNWNLYALPNKTIVRSVEIGYDNNIYVGGQDELGYFSPAKNGQLQYHSLTARISAKDKSFGDVWDIVSFQNELFFRSSNKIFRFTNQKLEAYAPTSEWAYLGLCNGILYAQDYKSGLMTFKNEHWQTSFEKNTIPYHDPITGILPSRKGNAIITTLKSGLYGLSNEGISKLPTANNTKFENERIYAATKINAEWMVLATSNSGICIIDLDGNIIQSFSGKEGLQNNNVLSIFLDRQSNLWLGLDNGIDLIAYNSAIKQIIPFFQEGSGYTSIIHQNQLFIGTSNGLFCVPLQNMNDLSFSKGSFSSVNNTKAQIWGLAEINSQLLLGSHEGAFKIENNSAIPISTREGFWNFVTLPSTLPTSQCIAGNYEGFSLFDFKNGQFLDSKPVETFNESSRFVEIDQNGDIWISHPYHGVYRIRKKTDGTSSTFHYANQSGLPSILNNHVYKIKNKIVMASEKGVFEFNNSRNIFEPALFYQKLLGNQSIRYLKEDKSGNIWFIHEKKLGVIDISGKDPSVIYLPELNNKMLSGFEFIYPVNDNNIFLGGEKGFFHINYDKYKKTATDLQVQVRTVKITDKTDSLLFGGYYKSVNEAQLQPRENIPEVNNNWKTIHIEFSAALYGYQSSIEYSYRLKGFDDNWSDFNKRTDKEYTNLPAGDYTFEVKARNNLGKESPVAFYSFNMLPPWYQTIWASFAYVLLMVSLLAGLYKFLKKKFRVQRLRYEQEQQKLLYIHELERNKAETELISLGNEKLEAEISFKNSELASSAMHLVKKGELIAKVKGEITQIMKGLDNAQANTALKKMIKTLNEDDNMDKEWENFSKHFDKVQSDFLVDIKEIHPALTGNELKLCAYLRMNLSTKEIAQLMNISARGVEISRYRLRKKLQITSEMSLFDYLIKFQAKI